MPYLITPTRQRIHTQTIQHVQMNIHRDELGDVFCDFKFVNSHNACYLVDEKTKAWQRYPGYPNSHRQAF